MLSFSYRREIKKQIQSHFIASPCTMRWDEMQGDQSVRFCGSCKLNVHNLSNLPDQEVVALLNRRKAGERVCTYFYRDKRGKIVTDNCPKEVKQFRSRIQSYALGIVVALSWTLATNANGQGLPVDPRYGQSNEVGALGDYGYDTTRDLSRAAAVIALLLTVAYGWFRHKHVDRERLAKELLALGLIPILIWLVGNQIANNQPGLGGGI